MLSPSPRNALNSSDRDHRPSRNSTTNVPAHTLASTGGDTDVWLLNRPSCFRSRLMRGSAGMGQSARTACGCSFRVRFGMSRNMNFCLMFSLVSEMAARIPKTPTFWPGRSCQRPVLISLRGITMSRTSTPQPRPSPPHIPIPSPRVARNSCAYP